MYNLYTLNDLFWMFCCRQIWSRFEMWQIHGFQVKLSRQTVIALATPTCCQIGVYVFSRHWAAGWTNGCKHQLSTTAPCILHYLTGIHSKARIALLYKAQPTNNNTHTQTQALTKPCEGWKNSFVLLYGFLFEWLVCSSFFHLFAQTIDRVRRNVICNDINPIPLLRIFLIFNQLTTKITYLTHYFKQYWG